MNEAYDDTCMGVQVFFIFRLLSPWTDTTRQIPLGRNKGRSIKEYRRLQEAQT